MTTYYEVLRPVEPADITQPRFAGILKMIPPRGRITFEMFRHVGGKRACHAVAHACAVGILRRVSPYERVMNLASVKFWCTQLNDSGLKNTAARCNTKELYLRGITRLDEWLPGRSFQSYETAIHDGQITRQAVKKSFANVEELMEYCNESDYGTKTARRAIREFLACQDAAGMSAGVQATTRSAIKSYFGAHDIVLDFPRGRKKHAGHVPDEGSVMALEDFYKILQNGKPSITVRTVMMIKLQSGMDSATLADCFNCEGYPQLVQYFKTADHESWDVDACPVPIKLVRVKTGVPYTTFLDRDAVTQLKEYLTWKEARHGRQDASKPLFLTKQNAKIHSAWVSLGFSEVAVRAGIQEKVSHRVFKMRAHAVRHLLKSTLKTSGCAQYAAEHVLGHAPRDPYEKQAILYPEMIRAEYAKASSRINIFSKVENILNSPDDPARQNARILELEAQVRELTQAKAGGGLDGGERNDVISAMNEKIKLLMRLVDLLPDDVKEKMSGELDGAD